MVAETIALRGLSQVNLFAEDVEQARDWCSGVLGCEAHCLRLAPIDGLLRVRAVIEREARFLTASLIDSSGNILGLIQRPHYVQVIDIRESDEDASDF